MRYPTLKFVQSRKLHVYLMYVQSEVVIGMFGSVFWVSPRCESACASHNYSFHILIVITHIHEFVSHLLYLLVCDPSLLTGM